MRITKNILWIMPFVHDAKKYVDINKIIQIKGVQSFPVNTVMPYAGITRSYPGGKFKIEVYIKYQKRTKPFGRNKCCLKVMPLSKIDILEVLAHELAHIASTYEHTPEHKIMECKIKTMFMRRLKRENYISEEVELG